MPPCTFTVNKEQKNASAAQMTEQDDDHGDSAHRLRLPMVSTTTAFEADRITKKECGDDGEGGDEEGEGHGRLRLKRRPVRKGAGVTLSVKRPRWCEPIFRLNEQLSQNPKTPR